MGHTHPFTKDLIVSAASPVEDTILVPWNGWIRRVSVALVSGPVGTAGLAIRTQPVATANIFDPILEYSTTALYPTFDAAECIHYEKSPIAERYYVALTLVATYSAIGPATIRVQLAIEGPSAPMAMGQGAV